MTRPAPERQQLDDHAMAEAIRAFLIDLLPRRVQQVDHAHLAHTPVRVVAMFRELIQGYADDPAQLLGTTFTDGYDEILLVRDITFYSTCIHHLVTFSGRAHVAYLPLHKVVGLSKLARLVDCYARRLQIQERMTQEIAHALMEHLRPRGAACVIEAEHLCMGCRGVKKPHTTTVTSVMLGAFRDDLPLRAELTALLHRRP